MLETALSQVAAKGLCLYEKLELSLMFPRESCVILRTAIVRKATSYKCVSLRIPEIEVN